MHDADTEAALLDQLFEDTAPVSTPPVLFVTTYPPGEEHLGGGGWIDRRVIGSLRDAGVDIEVYAVTGPEGTWSHDGITGHSAGSLPLEIRNDRSALLRVGRSMVTSTQPYLASKFSAFDGWDRAKDGLRRAAEGRAVITSQWPPMLLTAAAGVDIRVHIAHNVDTVIAEQHAPRPLRALGEVPRLRRLERRLLATPERVLTLSRTDAHLLDEWGVAAEPLLLPLRPVADASNHPNGAAVRIGFIGKATWPPNAEALDVLLGPVDEELGAVGSHAEFVLGGTGTEVFSEHPRVATAGWVDDVDTFYDGLTAIVVPRLGVSTGVSVKMLEAAERGVPAIVPAALAEAVDPAGPWFVADDPAEIVEAVGRVTVADGARALEWAGAQRPARTAAQLIDQLVG